MAWVPGRFIRREKMALGCWEGVCFPSGHQRHRLFGRGHHFGDGPAEGEGPDHGGGPVGLGLHGLPFSSYPLRCRGRHTRPPAPRWRPEFSRGCPAGSSAGRRWRWGAGNRAGVQAPPGGLPHPYFNLPRRGHDHPDQPVPLPGPGPVHRHGPPGRTGGGGQCSRNSWSSTSMVLLSLYST